VNNFKRLNELALRKIFGEKIKSPIPGCILALWEISLPGMAVEEDYRNHRPTFLARSIGILPEKARQNQCLFIPMRAR
jgi:hypothetical protein